MVLALFYISIVINIMIGTRKRRHERKNGKQSKNPKKWKKTKKRGKRGQFIHSLRHKGGERNPTNFSDTMYKFIDENLELFALHNVMEDHSMNIDCLTKYIEHQRENEKTSKLFWDFYEYFYKNIIYISNNDIIEQYEKNAHEIYNLSKNVHENGVEYHIIIILTNEISKSDYYFTLYFLHLYRNLYPDDYQNIHVIMESDIISGIVNDVSKHTIYIITDDVCYSGGQMHETIKHRYRKQFSRYKNGKDKNYSIYINVIGMTDISLNLIDTITWVKIIIPNECLTYKNITYNAIFNKYCKEYNYDMKIESVDMFFFTAKDRTLKSFTRELRIKMNLPLIYLPYKYPDFVSFPTDLCYFMDMPKTYFIAHDDYVGENIVTFNNNILENSTDEISFHKKCSQMNFVFQLNSMELFKDKYPELVYTIDTRELGTIYLLKLINNCNYDFINYDVKNKNYRPDCNNFCYKPFYKKKEYLNKVKKFLNNQSIDYT